jgi:peroxiredoxin
MAVESSMMALGTKAPDFSLLDCRKGSSHALEDVSGKNGTVVMFVSHHCPYVKHLHGGLSALYQDYKDKDLGFVGISSNDVENYPDDSPSNMAELWDTLSLDFPILYDESQKTAKAYDAQCTPDFFVFDSDGKCYYRGRFDGSKVGNPQDVTGDELRNALDRLLVGKTAPDTQYPSIGCSIKWKKG